MNDTPACIGIIMDGNRRWAVARGLPKLEGHRQGAEVLRETARNARDAGVKHLIVYAFSTENWQREQEEVGYLMDLLRDFFKNYLKDLSQENIRVRIVGQKDRFDPDIQKIFEETEHASTNNTGLTLWVCLSYGSRAEIVAAAKAACARGQEITEDSLAAHLWTAGMPDPDIIIRTSGEKRLSNFLLWQAAYSELFFIDTMWPDFTKDKLGQVLAEFAARERRRGK
ncbi:MAG: polyprenyl diphosphate synthase [Patescibacteria group bacterium]